MRRSKLYRYLVAVLLSTLSFGEGRALAGQRQTSSNFETFGEVGPDAYGGILAAPDQAWCQDGLAKVELRSFSPARTAKGQEENRAELARKGLTGQALERARDREFDVNKQRLAREIVGKLEQRCPGLKVVQLAHVFGVGLPAMRFCMRRESDWTETLGGCDGPAAAAHDNVYKFSLNWAVKDEAEIRGWSGTQATSFSNAIASFAAADINTALFGSDIAARLGARGPPGEPLLNHFRPEQLLAERRYDDVIRLIQPALANTGTKPLPSPDRVRRLALLAAAFEGLGRPADAVDALEEAASLENVDRFSGYRLPSLMSLGSVYERSGRFEDAAAVYDRGIALAQAAEHRPNSPPGTILLGRAFLLRSALLRRKQARADIPHRSILLTRSEMRFRGAMMASLRYFHTVVRSDAVPNDLLTAYDQDAPSDLLVALTGAAWAQLAFEIGDPDHVALARRLAVPARETLTHLRYETPFLAEAKTLLASLDRDLDAFQDALASVRATFGPDDPVLAYALTEQAQALLKAGRTAVALDAAQEATNILIRRADRNSGDQGLDAQAELADSKRAFDVYLQVAWQRAQEDPGSAMALAGEGFVLSQRLQQTAVGQAMARSLVRLASGGAAANLLRERQDLAERWTGLEREALVETLLPPAQRLKTEGLRQQIQQISARRAQLGALLQTLAPNLVELDRPRVVDVDQTRAVLGSNEAALLFHVGDNASFIWAVTADAVHWHRISLGAAAIEQAVVNLRNGLDHGGRKPGTFSTSDAYGLYHDLLGEVAPEIQHRPQLLVVPDGALQSLPFNMLVTEPPPPATQPDTYQHATWLIRDHSVQTLPSLGSLTIRSAKVAPANQAFIGIGDPLLDGTGTSTRGEAYPATDLRGKADPAEIRRWDRLPETADEIRQLATIMGADAASVLLGPEATEAKLRALDRTGVLARYRIVAFATHALVGGTLTGIAEPALILTPPAIASVEGDGLLTASEIVGMRLNADWVILSACNTAAGRPGAESLSGLARAFFQAGARSLLVSHWPVASDAAVRLTTSTLSELRQDATMSRAEALRRAMLALIDADPADADPWRWAPFVVVGGEN